MIHVLILLLFQLFYFSGTLNIGYMTTETNCNLTDYNSLLKCPDKISWRDLNVMLLETIGPKEEISFHSFHSIAPANWSSNSNSLLGALAHGMIDTVIFKLA